MVGRGGVEPPFSDFQSGTPTAYVTYPYKVDFYLCPDGKSTKTTQCFTY